MSDPSPPDDGPQGWASAFLADDAPATLGPLRQEKRRLADAMRSVIEHLVSTDAPIEVLASAAADLEQIAERFSGEAVATYEGFAEAANSPRHDGFFDHSPVLGRANPLAPPLHLELDGSVMRATARFGTAYEGPPGCVHGGWIAAAFDEVLGATQSLSGSGGMTGRLVVHYRSPTPLHEDLRFEGRLVGVDGRKISTVGQLFHGDRLTAEAEGLFISIDFSRFAELRARREQDRP